MGYAQTKNIQSCEVFATAISSDTFDTGGTGVALITQLNTPLLSPLPSQAYLKYKFLQAKNTAALLNYIDSNFVIKISTDGGTTKNNALLLSPHHFEVAASSSVSGEFNLYSRYYDISTYIKSDWTHNLYYDSITAAGDDLILYGICPSIIMYFY